MPTPQTYVHVVSQQPPLSAWFKKGDRHLASHLSAAQNLLLARSQSPFFEPGPFCVPKSVSSDVSKPILDYRFHHCRRAQPVVRSLIN